MAKQEKQDAAGVLGLLEQLEAIDNDSLQAAYDKLNEEYKAIGRKMKRIMGVLRVRQMQNVKRGPRKNKADKLDQDIRTITDQLRKRLQAMPASSQALADELGRPIAEMAPILHGDPSFEKTSGGLWRLRPTA